MLNREIAHKFNTGWEIDTVKGVEKSRESNQESNCESHSSVQTQTRRPAQPVILETDIISHIPHVFLDARSARIL
jgi:hypothetical protein